VKACTLRDESEVAQARRAAVVLAGRLGFDEADSGRVALVTTELATNLLKHGGGGELLLGDYEIEGAVGVEVVALDRGPGIANLAEAMRDGHSTTGTLGGGLGAVARQSSLMDVYSHGGNGAAVLARVQRRSGARSAPRGSRPVWGAVCLPMAGEEACGDAWAVQPEADALTAMVVDGLGHGPLAATAAHAAVCAFQAAHALPDATLMERLHRALRATRGAAASAMRLSRDGEVQFVGVGNVMGLVADSGGPRRMVSLNGTLGHALKTAKAFSYPASADALVVLASDGLASSWSLDAYPGLRLRHPTLIAAVLYRDFSRRRDDVTVFVARREAA